MEPVELMPHSQGFFNIPISWRDMLSLIYLRSKNPT